MENTQSLTIKTEWRPIPGYEGYYEASHSGHIRRIGGSQLAETFGKYCTVALSVKGIPKTKYVHRLVAAAFYGLSSLVVDHKNRSRRDNSVPNLRYLTQRENTSGDNVTPGKLGFKGISMNSEKYKKRYRARIRVNGKLEDLGSFHTAQEASTVYETKKQSLIKQYHDSAKNQTVGLRG